jgi:outer membrane protein TolC
MTRIAVILAVAASLAGAGALSAQSTNFIQRNISEAECIEMALKNNFELRIEQHNIEQARFDLQRSQTAYDPNMRFGLGRANNQQPHQTWDPMTGDRLESKTENTSDTLSYGVGGLGPMGLEYNVPVRYARNTGDGIFRELYNGNTGWNDLVPYDQYSASAMIELKQPLLKNFAIDSARYTIQVNKKFIKMSEFVYIGRMIEVVTLVRQTYYELIFAREYVKVQEQALKLAEKLLDNNQKSFNAGSMAILEVHRAGAEVATTKASLLVAKQLVVLQENQLKNLITKDLAEWKDVALYPSEQLLAIPQVLDVRESWRTGLAKRPDLAQLRVDLERQDLNIRFRKNQTLPSLSVVGGVGRDGLNTSFDNVFSDIHFENNAVDYYYGLELSFPWGNREAKMRLAQEKDQRLQKELILQQQQQNIMVQIDDNVQSVRTSFDRIAATRQAAEFALKVLQNEESRERVGVSTTFQLLQYQRDLTDARSQEVRAITDYNKAQARLMQAEGTTLERLKIQVEFK